MSTNGIIARSTGEATFKGVYHHWDSYPTGLGKFLTELLVGHFQNDLPKMLHTLLDEHNSWSTILNKDFSLRPGYTNVAARPEGMSIEDFYNLPLNRRPQCHCHGARHEKNEPVTEKDDCGASWAYVFDEEERILHVLDRDKNPDTQEYFWNDVGRVELDKLQEVNWTHIECGENYERCGHYAWAHNLLPKTSNLGTQTFLGRKPLDFHDVIGFIIDGKRVKATGSGGDADFLRSHYKLGPLPAHTWVATVVYSNGKRADLPVAIRDANGSRPYPNVKWIYPPTLVNPKETVVG